MFNGVDRSKIILHTPYDKKTAYENAGESASSMNTATGVPVQNTYTARGTR